MPDNASVAPDARFLFTGRRIAFASSLPFRKTGGMQRCLTTIIPRAVSPCLDLPLLDAEITPVNFRPVVGGFRVRLFRLRSGIVRAGPMSNPSMWCRVSRTPRARSSRPASNIPLMSRSVASRPPAPPRSRPTSMTRRSAISGYTTGKFSCPSQRHRHFAPHLPLRRLRASQPLWRRDRHIHVLRLGRRDCQPASRAGRYGHDRRRLAVDRRSVPAQCHDRTL